MTFLSVRGARFTSFFRDSFTHEFTSHVPHVHSLLVSSGFHSPVSSLSYLSEVDRLLISIGFHSPLSSLPCVSEVHGLLVSLGFDSPGNSLSMCQRCVVH